MKKWYLTGDICGKCKVKVNLEIEQGSQGSFVGGGTPGWVCDCGHYNVLPFHPCRMPFENPDKQIALHPWKHGIDDELPCTVPARPSREEIRYRLRRRGYGWML